MAVLKARVVQRILLIKWSAMGDVVLVTGLIDDIHNAYPQAQIDLNVLPPWQHLFEHDPRIKRLICFPLRRAGWRASWRWLRMIMTGDYDLIVDWQGSDRSRLLMGLARCLGVWKAQYIHGLPKNHTSVSSCQIAQPSVHALNLPASHAFMRHCSALRSAHIAVSSSSPHIYSTRERYHQVIALDLQHPYVVFIPGCSQQAPSKRWPTAHFIALAQLLLQSEYIAQIVLIGAQEEQHVCQEIADALGGAAVNLCCQTTLTEIPMICQRAYAVVSNDTGSAHIASAKVTCTEESQTKQSVSVLTLDTLAPKIIVLFGPTDSQRSQPLGERVVALHTALPCQPCFARQCIHQSCMSLLSARQVYERIFDEY